MKNNRLYGNTINDSNYCIQVNLWLYNVTSEKTRLVTHRLEALCSWHTKRAGFLQLVLTQKMGLMCHTGATDVAMATKVNHFNRSSFCSHARLCRQLSSIAIIHSI